MTFKSNMIALVLGLITALSFPVFAQSFDSEQANKGTVSAGFALKSGVVFQGGRTYWASRGRFDLDVNQGSLEGLHFDVSGMGGFNFSPQKFRVADVNTAVGYTFGSDTFKVRPLLGYAYNHSSASFGGNVSANFYGPFIGLDLSTTFADNHMVNVRGEFHALTKANAKIAGRSFSSTPDNYGFAVGATYGYKMNDSWMLTLDARYDDRHANRGMLLKRTELMAGVKVSF